MPGVTGSSAPHAQSSPLAVPQSVQQWVADMAEYVRPDQIVWCNGSEPEADRPHGAGRRNRECFIRLNQEKLPGCYLHRSNPNDVARTEHLHLHLHAHRGRWPAPPTTGWTPRQAYAKLRGLFDGCMQGRTMYVVPFVMGPLGSPLAKVGVRAHRLALRRRSTWAS